MVVYGHDLVDEGTRLIAMNAPLDERNGGMPSRTIAYGARMLGYGTSYAYLEKHMADHEERYSGPEWDRYWDYARYTVGAVQQMKMDNRLLGDLNSRDFNLPETYEYIFNTRKDYARFNDVKAGVVLPLRILISSSFLFKLTVCPDSLRTKARNNGHWLGLLSEIWL